MADQRDSLAAKLDADLDRYMDELAANSKNAKREKPFDFDEWCKEIDQHPAFLKELKPDQDGQYSAEVQAIQALKFDDEDPLECVIAHKEEGNRHFAQKKYRLAIDAYTKGIRRACADSQLNSILYANRAAANRRLGNLRSAFRDCLFARRLQPDNYKAILRGAECLLDLKQATKCIQWIDSCEIGTFDGERKENLEKFRKNAAKLKLLEDRDARKERSLMGVEGRRKRELFDALKCRKIIIRPNVDDLDDLSSLEITFGPLDQTVCVHLNENQLVWPLLLQYPEMAQTDFVAECAENVPLSEILANVFESPAEWDPEHQFNIKNIRYFVPLDLPNCGEQIREVLPERDTLGDVLKWPNIIVKHGLPIIQVYTRKYIQPKLRMTMEIEQIFEFVT